MTVNLQANTYFSKVRKRWVSVNTSIDLCMLQSKRLKYIRQEAPKSSILTMFQSRQVSLYANRAFSLPRLMRTKYLPWSFFYNTYGRAYLPAHSHLHCEQTEECGWRIIRPLGEEQHRCHGHKSQTDLCSCVRDHWGCCISHKHSGSLHRSSEGWKEIH